MKVINTRQEKSVVVQTQDSTDPSKLVLDWTSQLVTSSGNRVQLTDWEMKKYLSVL